MAEKLEEVEDLQEVKVQHPKRAKLTAEETRARMEAFTREREEAFVAAVREDAG